MVLLKDAHTLVMRPFQIRKMSQRKWSIEYVVNSSQRLLPVHQLKPNPVGHSGLAAIWFGSPIALPLLRPCVQFAIRRSDSVQIFRILVLERFGQETTRARTIRSYESCEGWIAVGECMTSHAMRSHAMRSRDSRQLLLPAHWVGLGWEMEAGAPGSGWTWMKVNRFLDVLGKLSQLATTSPSATIFLKENR
jgi:hypothetical protein